MADGSKIEWTDATWNPITGCSVVSPGCTNCYAMRLAGTRMKHHPSRAGLTQASKAGPVWNGQVRLNEGWLTQPLQWSRPRMVFVCAHGDIGANGIELRANQRLIDNPHGGKTLVTRVGKKAAGRLLDGIEHNGFPA